MALGGERQRHDQRPFDGRLVGRRAHGAIGEALEDLRRSGRRVTGGRRRVSVEIQLVDRRELPARDAAERRQLQRAQRRDGALAARRQEARRGGRRRPRHLADAPFHLQLDEAVHLHRVLHRKLLDDRLDEAVDDQLRRLLLAQPVGHEVEELLLADLRDRRLVADVDVVLADADRRVGVRAALLVEEQRVADDLRLRAMRALGDLEQAPVRRPPAVLRDRLGEDVRRRVRRGVDDLAARVLVLAVAGERDREDLAVGALAHEVDGRVLHRQLRAEVAVDPLDRRVGLGDRALRDEVEDVVRPVLHGRVADAGARLGAQLDDRGVQRVGAVRRGSAALDVVHVGALVGEDQRALELAHVLRVDAEVGLQRHLDVDARGHVDERAARPHGAVESRELVVVRRDDRREVLLDEVLVLAQRGVHVREDHALGLELLVDLVVDDLGLVLRADAGEEVALGLGDAEPIEGLLDVLGHVVPRALGALGGAHEVVDLVEVDLGERRRAPRRHRAGEEVVERLEAEVAHPLRLALELGDLLDELAREALRRLVEVVLRVVEAVALGVVGVDVLERLVLREDGIGLDLRGGHVGQSTSSLMMSSTTRTGNVSTGTYAGNVLGLPVRRSNSDPWRGHSTVQFSGSSSPSASGPSSCEQRSSMAKSSPLQLKTPISRSSHSTMRVAPGGSSASGQMSMVSGMGGAPVSDATKSDADGLNYTGPSHPHGPGRASAARRPSGNAGAGAGSTPTARPRQGAVTRSVRFTVVLRVPDVAATVSRTVSRRFGATAAAGSFTRTVRRLPAASFTLVAGSFIALCPLNETVPVTRVVAAVLLCSHVTSRPFATGLGAAPSVTVSAGAAGSGVAGAGAGAGAGAAGAGAGGLGAAG